MKKRILALIVGIVMLVPCFASCGEIDNDYKGPYLQMYFSQQIFDLDPLHAYNNEAQLKVVSLIFSGLFKINDKGKVTNNLVKSYKVINKSESDEYKLQLTLNDTGWSDGSAVTAADVVFTFKRVLNQNNSNDAASMLYEIKNAKEVKSGDKSIDDLGVYAVGTLVVEITFETEITDEMLERFKYNLTSPALFPLRENDASATDWAKKPATMNCSGPFMVRKVSYETGRRRLVLERNPYYGMRDKEKEAVDKFVKLYRIIVDYEYTNDQQVELFNIGKSMYVGDISLAHRAQLGNTVKLSDSMSTHTYYFNQKALVASTKAGEENGFALFAIKEVREALSLAIDRTAIAASVVYAKAATGFVPEKVFETTSAKTLFRASGDTLLNSAADLSAAQAKLTAAGINPSDYSFAISVRDGDDDHILMADAVAESWNALGFKVTVNKLGVEEKAENEIDPGTGERQTDIRDDLFNEAIESGKYQVIALDMVAKTPDAFAVLAPFAVGYTGNALGKEGEVGNQTYTVPTHITGYNNKDYNKLIEDADAAETAEKRAGFLHQAEALLMEDMAVMPVVFNQDAYIISDSLKKVTTSYYGFLDFTKTKLSDWENYLAVFPDLAEY